MNNIIASILILAPILSYGYTDSGFDTYNKTYELFIQEEYERVLETCINFIRFCQNDEDRVHFWMLLIDTYKNMEREEEFQLSKKEFELFCASSEEALAEYSFFYTNDYLND